MPTYSLINTKLLQVNLQGDRVFSKRGSMIAIKGTVHLTPTFLGPGGFMDVGQRAVTGEGFHLMIAQGQGDVLYANRGQNVTIIKLTGETLYVESSSVLAFDERLRTGTMFLGNQGGISGLARGAMTGQGLFTTTFDGMGEVAILSDGEAIALDVSPDRPLFVDPQAYLGYRGQLTSSIHTDTSWKTFVGQGSGESFQLKFIGSGTVFIQASER